MLGEPMKPLPRRTAAALLALALTPLAGCATLATNRIAKDCEDPRPYTLAALGHEGNSDALFVVVACAGDGMRGAALSYGVLRALAGVTVFADGEARPLLQEVDVLTAVGGGAYTAAYYALFRERTFHDFTDRFLDVDVDYLMAWHAFYPADLRDMVVSGRFARSNRTTRWCDETLFEHRTFGDLAVGRKPLLLLNATDIGRGAWFGYTPAAFAALGSDLSTYSVGRAVAATAATPTLAVPVTLQNFAPACKRLPGWVGPALAGGTTDPRLRAFATAATAYADARHHPYIHLVDGAVADPLGLQPVIDTWLDPVSATTCADVLDGTVNAGSSAFVVIVVDGGHQAPDTMDEDPSAPRFFKARNGIADIPVPASARREAALVRSLLAARERAGGGRGFLVEVSLDDVPDPATRARFRSLPGALALPDRDVDGLVGAGSSLLWHSPDFTAMLAALQARP